MFGENLRKLRKARGLSQEELGELTQLGQSNISAWERGGRAPLPDGLIKLATFFGCSIDYLLLSHSTEDDIDAEIIKKIKTLPSDKKEEVLEFIDNIQK